MLSQILRQFTTSRRCDCHKRIDELEKSIENWKTKANQLEALLDRTILFHSDDNSAMKFSDSTKKTNVDMR